MRRRPSGLAMLAAAAFLLLVGARGAPEAARIDPEKVVEEDGAATVSSSPPPPPSGLKVLSATRTSIRLRWNYTTSVQGRLAGFRIFYFHHQSYEDVKTVGTEDTKGGKGKHRHKNQQEQDEGGQMQHYYELTGLGETVILLTYVLVSIYVI